MDISSYSGDEKWTAEMAQNYRRSGKRRRFSFQFLACQLCSFFAETAMAGGECPIFTF
jgi:hypothetical protein